MLIVGSLLALLCGLANSAAAALEKREGVQVAASGRGLRLLAVLVRRRWWLLAMGLSIVAWTAEAGALGLAPVPVVTTLRSAGRGGLLVAGHKWLGERFGRIEVVGVVLLGVGGVLTASSVIAANVAKPPLANVTELLVGVVAAAVAGACVLTGNGILEAAAVGVLFVATGVFTKEIGDRAVRHGAAAVVPLLATPGVWIMPAFSVWSISILQTAFLRANAATVSAVSTTVSANGLIVAGILLYHEPRASGFAALPLVVGIVVSAIGAIAIAAADVTARPDQEPAGHPAGDGDGAGDVDGEGGGGAGN